ncbi:MAG: SDR family oxidoreductase [Balneolales bacterium]
MTNFFNISDKLAVITGGGTGLGLGISEAFVEAGAKIIITGRREDVLIDACKHLGEQASYINNDITDLNSIPALVEDIETEYGPIDILVNNAGVNAKKNVLDVTDDDFQSILQTNLTGLFSLTREVSKKMASRNKGSIIMVTSMAAIYGIPNVTAYTASKSAVLGMTRSLAVDLSPLGIRVNAIAPGFIETPMSRKAFSADPERKRKVLGRTPLQKLGTPGDVAAAAIYLASDSSKFITGINLPVDGGNSIGF